VGGGTGITLFFFMFYQVRIWLGRLSRCVEWFSEGRPEQGPPLVPSEITYKINFECGNL
jgi:hypothetical protein